MNKQEFFLFDSRYTKNPYKATCFEVCETFREAVDSAPDYGDDVVIVRYDINDKSEMINPKIMNQGDLI